MNPLNSSRKYTDHCIPLWRANYSILQALLVANGFTADKYSVLEPACGGSYQELEERKADWVNLYLTALGSGIELTTVPDINSCESPANPTASISDSSSSSSSSSSS